MRLENAVAGDVLERILSAYGFSMQKELSDRLEIAKSNVASWLARGQIPGNVIVQCALDTGVDVNWLVTGQLEKANSIVNTHLNITGKALYEEVMANGGKPVLRRILDAYGFTMQKQLCDLLDISSGTVSTWIRRNYFPGDVVVACALETGVDLEWLATGKGHSPNMHRDDCQNFIPRKNLSAGILIEAGNFCIDLSFISTPIIKPLFLCENINYWIIDMHINEISNGTWLIGIENKHDIYKAMVLPKHKVKLTNRNSDFIFEIGDIEVLGKVIVFMDCGN